MTPEGHVDSWYAASALAAPGRPVLRGDLTVDVCVIGGGYTGLTSALALSRRGYRVALLEARQVGWGASGRNGGQASGRPRLDLETLAARFGADTARAQWEMNQAALANLRQLIATHGIDCDWQNGLITACHRRRDVAWYRRYAEMLQRDYGSQVDFIDAVSLAQDIGTDHYHGGMVDCSGGHLHPLNLALGLARAAEAAGAVLFEHSEVTGYDRHQPVTVRTARGRITAQYLVLACNAYLGRLEPRLAGRIMPINNFMVATAPLPQRLIRSGAAVADSRFVVNYWRCTRDNRLLFGGGENYRRGFPRDIRAFVKPWLLRVYPQLANTRLDYGWGGTLAITLNRMPHFGRLSPNVFFAQGYSGHGVALATFAGTLIAEALAGQAERFDVFARVPIRRFPGGTLLRWPGMVAGMWYYALRDRLG